VATLHVRYHSASEHGRTSEIQLERIVPFAVGSLKEIAGRRAARIGDADVDGVEYLNGVANEIFNSSAVANVDRFGMGLNVELLANVFGQAIQRFAVASG
jgi:hypothetical protein